MLYLAQIKQKQQNKQTNILKYFDRDQCNPYPHLRSDASKRSLQSCLLSPYIQRNGFCHVVNV